MAEGLCVRGGGRAGWSGTERRRSCDSLMPEKVCVMCFFFLPLVHRRKAQAQFPSLNRAARVSSSVKNTCCWLGRWGREVGAVLLADGVEGGRWETDEPEAGFCPV